MKQQAMSSALLASTRLLSLQSRDRHLASMRGAVVACDTFIKNFFSFSCATLGYSTMAFSVMRFFKTTRASYTHSVNKHLSEAHYMYISKTLYTLPLRLLMFVLETLT